MQIKPNFYSIIKKNLTQVKSVVITFITIMLLQLCPNIYIFILVP